MRARLALLDQAVDFRGEDALFQAEKAEHLVHLSQDRKDFIFLFYAQRTRMQDRVYFFDKIKQSADRPGYIQVIIKRCEKVFFHGGNAGTYHRMRQAGMEAEQLAGEFVNAFQRFSD